VGEIDVYVPALSSKEILHINSLLPNKNAKNKITKKLYFLFDDENPEESILSYINFYKYYPNFHHVNL
jgi:hypothetical protein